MGRLHFPSVSFFLPDMADIVQAQISYALPPADGSKPYSVAYAIDPETKERKRNYSTQTHQVEMENVRGKEDSYTLDTAGFQFVKAEPKHKSFTNDEDIAREYYPESIELIKKITGASRVVVFDHSESNKNLMNTFLTKVAALRRRTPEQPLDNPGNRQPARMAHVDQSTGGAIGRVHRHLPPAEAPGLLQRRFQIINLWRPIENPAYDWPLAFCDYRSIDKKNDVIPSDLIYPDRTGENCVVRYSPAHKWKYLRGIRPDEAALIKW